MPFQVKHVWLSVVKVLSDEMLSETILLDTACVVAPQWPQHLSMDDTTAVVAPKGPQQTLCLLLLVGLPMAPQLFTE